mgnify:CR=1 FL=1
MMKRALVIEQRAQKAVEEKKKLLKNLEKAEELKLFPLKHHRETVIRAENLELFYGEKKVTGPLNFEVKKWGTGHSKREKWMWKIKYAKADSGRSYFLSGQIRGCLRLGNILCFSGCRAALWDD